MNFLRISFLHFSIFIFLSRSRVQGNGAKEIAEGTENTFECVDIRDVARLAQVS
jgi:cold shock CspA family protein